MQSPVKFPEVSAVWFPGHDVCRCTQGLPVIIFINQASHFSSPQIERGSIVLVLNRSAVLLCRRTYPPLAGVVDAVSTLVGVGLAGGPLRNSVIDRITYR